jgi:predicted RNA-binding protein with EMAP domain
LYQGAILPLLESLWIIAPVFISLRVASYSVERGLSRASKAQQMVNALDTAKDARILVLEDALRRLNEVVGNRKLKLHIDYTQLGTLLQQAGSLIYEVKYSYVPATALADLEATQKIVANIGEFRRTLEEAIRTSGYKPSSVKETLTLADVFYSFRIVETVVQKLRDFDDEPAYAVDILAVEISQIQAVSGSKNLIECRCTDGSRIWKIVTNIQGVNPGMKLACAVLPPVEMMDIVSEAMFLGGQPLSEDTELGPLNKPPLAILDQARAQVLHIIKRMT